MLATLRDDRTDRRCRWGIVALIVVHLGLLLRLAITTPWTSDENAYLMAGIGLRRLFEFDSSATILQGPLPSYANQLAGLFGADYQGSLIPLPDNKIHGRVGMLLFSLVSIVALARLAWRGLGPRAALLAVLCYALNPLVLAHGCLMTADMALTAASTIAVLACWRYLEAPNPGRAALLGASLGIAMATKYLAILLVLALGLAIAVDFGRRWWRRSKAPVRRLGTLLDAAVCVGVAIVAVHACYQFRGGFYDPAATPPISSTLERLPLVSDVSRILPSPLVRGIDFQLNAGAAGQHTMFWGQVCAGHPAYFLVALAIKLPLALLVLLLLSATRHAPEHRLPPRLAWITGTVLVVTLGYMSLGATLQIGVRYVLPAVPLLILVAARPIAGFWQPGAGHRLHRAFLLLVAAGHIAGVAWHWPHMISACNPLAGSRPYLLFGDSTVGWQMSPSLDPDYRTLCRRYPQAGRVVFASGPRLGEVIAHGIDLWPIRSPEFGPVRHWLRRFWPADRRSTFVYFDLTEGDFRRSIDAATTPQQRQRRRRDLVVALLGAGRLDDAQAVLREHPTVATPAIDAQVRTLGAAVVDRQAARFGWASLYRYDLVLADPEATAAQRAHAHFNRTEYQDSRRILTEEHRKRRLTIPELMQLTVSQLRDRAIFAAIEVWKDYTPPPGSPGRAAHLQHLQRIEPIAADLRRLLVQTGTPRPW